MFRSDASDQGWGATACDQVVSGRWESDEVDSSINVRELLAIKKGLHSFLPFLNGQSVVVFSNNTTALSCLRHQGGTLSKRLNHIAQRLLRWAESQELVLHPQFVMGCCNAVVDSLLEAQSDHWVRVDASPSGVRISSEAVVGDGGLICHLTKSPLVCLFCAHV